jgi:hypothetical protein
MKYSFLNIVIKKANIQIVILSVTFSILFYYFRDVSGIINAENIPGSLGGEGISDLYRYYHYYQDNTINSISAMGIFNSALYHWIVFFFKIIGVSFESFLFLLILSYYIVFAKLSNGFIGVKKWYIISFVFFILSYWLIPLATVAVRQGLAILILAAFWPFLEKKKSYFLEIFIILIVANIHTTALSLLPLIIFIRVFRRRLILLDFILFITLLLYILNFWVSLNMLMLSLLDYVNIDKRSFMNPDHQYKLGFSSAKAAAFLIPVVLYRAPLYLNYIRFKQLEGMYLFYVYFGMLAMFLSGLPHYGRIFLYCWAFSPIFIASFLVYILPFRVSKQSPEAT